jgi:hypothetical protein
MTYDRRAGPPVGLATLDLPREQRDDCWMCHR